MNIVKLIVFGGIFLVPSTESSRARSNSLYLPEFKLPQDSVGKIENSSHQRPPALISSSKTAKFAIENIQSKGGDDCNELEHYLIRQTRGLDNDDAIAKIDQLGETEIFLKCQDESRKFAIYRVREFYLSRQVGGGENNDEDSFIGRSLTIKPLHEKSSCFGFEEDTRKMIVRILGFDIPSTETQWNNQKERALEILSKQFEKVDNTCPKLIRAQIIQEGLNRVMRAFKGRRMNFEPEFLPECEEFQSYLAIQVSKICQFAVNDNIDRARERKVRSLATFNKFVEKKRPEAVDTRCPPDIADEWVIKYTKDIEDFYARVIGDLEQAAAETAEKSRGNSRSILRRMASTFGGTPPRSID